MNTIQSIRNEADSMRATADNLDNLANALAIEPKVIERLIAALVRIRNDGSHWSATIANNALRGVNTEAA